MPGPLPEHVVADARHERRDEEDAETRRDRAEEVGQAPLGRRAQHGEQGCRQDSEQDQVVGQERGAAGGEEKWPARARALTTTSPASSNRAVYRYRITAGSSASA